MKIKQGWVVYQVVQGEGNSLTLEKVKFSRAQIKDVFDTEDDAIIALMGDKKLYRNYIILKQTLIIK